MKQTIGFFVLFAFTAGSFSLFDYLRNSTTEELIHCAVGKSAPVVPSWLCAEYVLQKRGSQEDIAELERGEGLAIIFDMERIDKRTQLFRFLIRKGIGVNVPCPETGQSPLHKAIVLNDADLVALLLKNGADAKQPNAKTGEDPAQLINRLWSQTPDVSREAVEKLICLATSGNESP